jgi:hypothetical protein
VSVLASCLTGGQTSCAVSPPPAPESTGGWLQRWTDHPGTELARLWHSLTAILGGLSDHPWVTASAVAALAVVVVAWCLWRRTRRGRQAADGQVLVIRPPAHVPPGGALVLWRNLAGLAAPRWKRLLLGQPHLTLDYHLDVNGLRVQVWVPGTVPPGLVEHAVHAAWPGADIHPDPEPTQFQAVSKSAQPVVGGVFGLTRPEWLPIQVRFDADPLRPLWEVGAQLRAGRAVWVQVLARPASPRRAAGVRRAAWALRNHTATTSLGIDGLLTRGVDAAVGSGLDLFTGTPPRRRQPGRVGAVDPYAAETIRVVRDKTSQPLWEIAIRYAVTAPDRRQARGIGDAVASAFAVFAGPNQLARHRLHHPTQTLAGRRLGRGFLASAAELAAVAHLPHDPDAPGVDRAGARAVAPNPRVPASGRGIKVLGDSDALPGRPIGVHAADARHHLHVLGATGSGKSTLLAHLVLQDVAAGRGVLLIDPKGDLVTDLLDHLPARAADRLTLFDPDDATLTPPRLNVLDGADPDLVADQVVGIFHRIYAAWWGPRTDDILRAAVLTLTHPTNKTRPDIAHLGSIPRLLTEDAYRRRITAPLHNTTSGGGSAGGRDRILAGFWSWYDTLTDGARAQVIGPVMNKLRAFLLRDFVHTTLAGGPSTVDMRAVLDGGICLARIPKGTLGEDTTRLLGSFLLARAWQTAAARARQPHHQRREASIVLDEAHNFLTLPHSLDDMLAEARAYRLSLVLAHQNLAQLPRELKEAISTNARNKVYFQTSPEDGHTLERHLAPALTGHDLAHLDGYTAATRLLVDARPVPACTLRTRPLPQPVPGRAEHLRRAARTRQQPRPPGRDDRSRLPGGNAAGPASAA